MNLKSNRIGISINEDKIRIIKIKNKKDKFFIERYESFNLPKYSNIENIFTEDIAFQFKDFLIKKNLKINSAIIGLDNNLIDINYEKLPYVSQERLPFTIKVKIEDTLKSKKERLSYDYFIVNKESTEKNIGIIFIHDKLLTKIINFFKSINIKVIFFVPNIIGYLIQLYYLNYSKDYKNFILGIDIYKNRINILIFKRNFEYLFIRCFNLENTNKNLYVDFYLKSIDASIKFFKALTNESNLEFDNIIINQKVENLNTRIKEFLKYKNNICIFPKNLKDIIFNYDKIKELDNYCLGLAYISLFPNKSPIKIYALTQKIYKVLKKRVYCYISLGIISLSIIFSIILNINNKNLLKKKKEKLLKRYSNISLKINKINNFVNSYNNIVKKIKILKKYSNKEILNILSWLYKNIPSPLYITLFKYKKIKNNNILIILKGEIEESNKDVYEVIKVFKKMLKKSFSLFIFKEEDPYFDEERGVLMFTLYLKIKKLK